MEKSVVRKFRKRPVTIEAMQITSGESVLSIAEWIDNPQTGYSTNPPTVWIETLEGRMEGSIGDWVIKGTEGEFYPCKPDIFNKIYQEV
jgi:hypothetical protein